MKVLPVGVMFLFFMGIFERYMAIPAQALSYKIGALKIRELKAKYKKQLENKFALLAFHDELLKDGVMPHDVLEAKMDAWAASI